jgi:hypothetical protein
MGVDGPQCQPCRYGIRLSGMCVVLTEIQKPEIREVLEIERQKSCHLVAQKIAVHEGNQRLNKLSVGLGCFVLSRVMENWHLGQERLRRLLLQTNSQYLQLGQLVKLWR